MYQHASPMQYPQYGSTAFCATEDMDARTAGFEQKGRVSCPVDWYLDNTENPQALQTFLSFQVCICILCLISLPVLMAKW